MSKINKKLHAVYDDTKESVECEIYSSIKDINAEQPYLSLEVDGMVCYVEGTKNISDIYRTRITCENTTSQETFYLRKISDSSIGSDTIIFNTQGMHTFTVPAGITKLFILEVGSGSYINMNKDTVGVKYSEYQDLITKPESTYFQSGGVQEDASTGHYIASDGKTNIDKPLITGYHTVNGDLQIEKIARNLNIYFGLPFYRYYEVTNKYLIAPSGAINMRYVNVTPGKQYNVYIGKDGYSVKHGSNPNPGSHLEERRDEKGELYVKDDGMGRVNKKVIYNKPGDYMLTVPKGVRQLIVNMCGAGGKPSKGNYDSTYTEKCSVVFNVAGGSPEPSSQLIDKGSKISKPQDPVIEGYDFLGWEEYTPNGNSIFGDYFTCSKGADGTSSTSNLPEQGGIGGGNKNNPTFARVIDVNKYGKGADGATIPSVSCAELGIGNTLAGGVGGKAGNSGSSGRVSFVGIASSSGDFWYKSGAAGGSGRFVENEIVDVTEGTKINIQVGASNYHGAGNGFCQVEYSEEYIPPVVATGYPNTGFVVIKYGPKVENEDLDNFTYYTYDPKFVDDLDTLFMAPKPTIFNSLWNIRIKMLEYGIGTKVENELGLGTGTVKNPTLFYWNEETKVWVEHTILGNPDVPEVITGNVYSNKWRIGYKDISGTNVKFMPGIYIKNIELYDE